MLSLVLCTFAALACSACGSSATSQSSLADETPTGPPLPSSLCAPTIATTLATIATRIYQEAATGSIAKEALQRIQQSGALAASISEGNATRTGKLLHRLLAGQIVRIEILRSGHLFAAAGSGPAIAPIEGSIPGSGDARFVLSIQADSAYLHVARQITGAQVLLLAHTHRLAGTIQGPAPTELSSGGPRGTGRSLHYRGRAYRLIFLSGSRYPAGSLRIALLVPSTGLSCPGPAAQTRMETLGRVGERIYREEQNSPYVRATLRHMQSNPAFRDAVAAANVSAARAAIVGFFGAHIHVVRVRVTIGSHLLIDLGGPHVLAPARGTLRKDGKIVGRFSMAIQDDAGYLRLTHLFTGAQILMRTATGQAAGTLNPGPSTLPNRGLLSYDGRAYAVYSFTGEAFPSGPLRITLLADSQTLG